jgi:ATP-binding cassette subfamily B protein AbcA/BmrA
VLQEPQLFDGTIWDNIVYGLDRNVTDEEVRTVARLACADDFIMELPEGYKYDIGENGENLSAGQRQRLAIARALLLDPAYILLDEATCNMDAHSENIVNDTLFNVMKGRTIIMISHDMRMLKRADQVIVLKDGGVEACGPVEEVEKNSETLRKLITAEA